MHKVRRTAWKWMFLCANKWTDTLDQILQSCFKQKCHLFSAFSVSTMLVAYIRFASRWFECTCSVFKNFFVFNSWKIIYSYLILSLLSLSLFGLHMPGRYKCIENNPYCFVLDSCILQRKIPIALGFCVYKLLLEVYL